MPIDTTPPRFPLHESLVRFFAADRREPVAVSRVAELLGVTPETFRTMLDHEGGRRDDADTLPWADAAGYLLDAWPLARLLETLGPEHAHRVPRDFHPTRVAWSIPIFIVRAMEHQAAAAWRRDPRVQDSASPEPGTASGRCTTT